MAESQTITKSYTLKKLDITKNIGASTMAKGQLNVDAISLINSFRDLYIYHDIDQTVTSGEIIIQEQGNLPKTFPIMGWERIDIEFQALGSSGITYDSYKRSFFVYAIDEMIDSGDVKFYTIHFADLSALINVSSRLEHRYVGKAEDIISEICNSDIFAKHGLKNTADGTSTNAINLSCKTQTQFDMDFVAPSWKPFDFINKIASLAVGGVSGPAGGALKGAEIGGLSSGDKPLTEYSSTFSDCIFFQQTDGKFYFTSWLNLFQNIVSTTFKKYPRNDNTIKDKYVITNYNLSRLYNTQTQAMTGMFGLVSKVIDVSNMSINTFHTYYYKSDVGKDKGTYSAIGVEELPTGEAIQAGYIDSLISPYYWQQKNAKITYDPRFSAIKMSPAACITVNACGFSESEMARGGRTSNLQGVSKETAMYAYARGHACNLNLRAKSVTLTLNPCSDLKLGQLVTIQAGSTESQKTDITSIEEFLNGIWYIGKIKYHLTFSEIEVNVECYSSYLGLR
jgi:hypothetical protein